MNAPQNASKSWSWKRLPQSMLAFAIGAAAGAALCGVSWVVRGNADPFSVDWPLYLQLGSLSLSLLLAFLFRSPFATAFGLFFGLVAYMLIDGQAEYPIASVIALTVNGLLPAMAGALIYFGIQLAIRPKRVKGV